jgi:hypothetical protein
LEKYLISLNDLINIHRYMSVGKLVNGLIHNLNGPLHSLGIEMDVLSHYLSKQGGTSEPMMNIANRLKRMDEEFENLTRLIRLSASRIDLLQEDTEYFSLNHFLDQGLEFMKANLYYKHEVRTSLELTGDLPSIKNPPEKLPLGLAWFIQDLVEELEKRKIHSLQIQSFMHESCPSLRFVTGGETFFHRLDDILRGNPQTGIESGLDDLGLSLAVKVLLSAGVRIDTGVQDRESQVTLTFPGTA